MLDSLSTVYMIQTLINFVHNKIHSLLKMALASGHWVEKDTKGMPPSPRAGHAFAVAGNIAFLHGGVSNANSVPEYLNDFYMITVSPSGITWEMMPQNGVIPLAREGHSLCVVKGKLYLFGGSCYAEAKECLPGVYCFDVVTLKWEKLNTGGVALKTLRHSSAALGDNIYIYGGILEGTPRDDLMMFNTVSLIWTPIKTSGTPPSARYNHTCAVVNEQIFLFGGCEADGSYYKDIHVLNIETLTWQKCEVKGESPLSCTGQTFTAHRDKDIYMFGGMIQSSDGKISSTNEIHKLSLAKMKWKVPLYVGIPPARRHGHAAFIIHSHMYVFGGRNEEQEFNDLKIMKLINPSERQPVMKEILSEFGLQGVSNSFVPTKVPNVRYELSETPVAMRIERTGSAQPTAYQDFSTVRGEALTLFHKAFAILDEQFQKLDREKSDLSEAVEVLRCERQAINEYHQKQSQEIQDMLERHRLQNEAWLRARAEENDKERKELCKLREEVLHEQEKLKEEQCNIQKRSEHLLSIMQQFKGM
ncbi:acyl-CoA-binding domain-containing protein 6 [Tachysurus fulvidraco]|uniref:acyl-CoA-binding domain-containing protein 6 n=1 Tax=Tachysurus fulvidraco TaxID=1234273 RepID=UPI001FF06BFD|nr:acyl-CoA-binding domain-containing protein 6 [Tachysurus fulvidraco]